MAPPEDGKALQSWDLNILCNIALLLFFCFAIYLFDYPEDHIKIAARTQQPGGDAAKEARRQDSFDEGKSRWCPIPPPPSLFPRLPSPPALSQPPRPTKPALPTKPSLPPNPSLASNPSLAPIPSLPPKPSLAPIPSLPPKPSLAPKPSLPPQPHLPSLPLVLKKYSSTQHLSNVKFSAIPEEDELAEHEGRRTKSATAKVEGTANSPQEPVAVWLEGISTPRSALDPQGAAPAPRSSAHAASCAWDYAAFAPPPSLPGSAAGAAAAAADASLYVSPPPPFAAPQGRPRPLLPKPGARPPAPHHVACS